jgi:hypothetical protein
MTKWHKRFRFLAVAIGLTAMGANAGAAPPQSGTFLEFTNAPAPSQPLTEVPHLRIGVDGSLVSAVMDTGSTGVVISATSIPHLDQLKSLGPGVIIYSSSGRIMNGRWVVTPLVIAGRNAEIRTRPIAVLAVDSITCTATARRCTAQDHPTHVAMLGIGFGREHDRQPGGTPDHNPLLNLATDTPHSYVITRRGIAIGAARDGFTTVPLARDTAHGDWSAPPACIVLNDGPASCGTVLVDTGITGMFLTLPPERLPAGSAEAKTLPAGTRIAIALAPGGKGGAPISHVVRVDDGTDAAAPATVTLSGIGKRPTFVNTGAHLLNRFDYLYDADAGVVGYRPAAPTTR